MAETTVLSRRKGGGIGIEKSLFSVDSMQSDHKIFLFFLVKVALFKDEEEGPPPPFL